MRIAVYSRKSVYTGKGESIENQVEMCRQYIAKFLDPAGAAEIVVFEDEGFSGRDLDRPQFQRMLAEARQGKLAYIVCYRLDRISRSVGDFAPLVEDLIAREVGLVCIREQFDTSTPMGKAMMYIASVFAQLERETIAERVRDNMRLLARTGRWLGGTPPTGFLSERASELVVDGRVKTACRLRWDPDEIETARTIYRSFLACRSLSGVCKRLAREGIQSRTGRSFSVPGVREILRNPVYCIADREARDFFEQEGADLCFTRAECSDQLGLLAYNKRDGARQGAPRQSRAEWIVAVGRHRGIVPGRDWVAVQRLLEANRPASCAPTPHNRYALLSGLLRCGGCGSRMFSKPRGNHPEKFDYLCGAKLRAGAAACHCHNLEGTQADAAVFHFVLQQAGPSKRELRGALEKLRRELMQQPDIAADPVEEELGRCERELGQLAAALSRPELSPALFGRVNERAAQLDRRAQALREALSQRGPGAKAVPLPALPDPARWPQSAEELTTAERRDLLRCCVERVNWDAGRCDLFLYRGPGERLP